MDDVAEDDRGWKYAEDRQTENHPRKTTYLWYGRTALYEAQFVPLGEGADDRTTTDVAPT